MISGYGNTVTSFWAPNHDTLHSKPMLFQICDILWPALWIFGVAFFWDMPMWRQSVASGDRPAATIAFWKYFGNIPSSQSQRDRNTCKASNQWDLNSSLGDRCFARLKSSLCVLEFLTWQTRFWQRRRFVGILADWTQSEISIRPTINLLSLIHQFWLGADSYTKRKVSSWKSQCAHAWIISPGIFLLFQCVCRIQGGWINERFAGANLWRTGHWSWPTWAKNGKHNYHRSSMNWSRSAHPKTHDVCVIHHTVLNLVVP